MLGIGHEWTSLQNYKSWFAGQNWHIGCGKTVPGARWLQINLDPTPQSNLCTTKQHQRVGRQKALYVFSSSSSSSSSSSLALLLSCTWCLKVLGSSVSLLCCLSF